MGGIGGAVKGMFGVGAKGRSFDEQNASKGGVGMMVFPKDVGLPPPPAPDLTDQMVRAAQRAEAMRLKTGRTRQSTFVAANNKIGGSF